MRYGRRCGRQRQAAVCERLAEGFPPLFPHSPNGRQQREERMERNQKGMLIRGAKKKNDSAKHGKVKGIIVVKLRKPLLEKSWKGKDHQKETSILTERVEGRKIENNKIGQRRKEGHWDMDGWII
jgi:hypothetical protein